MHVCAVSKDRGWRSTVQAALAGEEGVRFSHADGWPEVQQRIANDPPDLVIVHRVVLEGLDQAAIVEATRPGRWPALLLLDEAQASAPVSEVAAPLVRRRLEPLLEIGELAIDTRKKRVGLRGRWVRLPPLQYRLLLVLAQRRGEVVGYRELLQLVWGYDGDEGEARELIKVQVRQIRRRLGLPADKDTYLHSVRGFGYMVATPEEVG